MRGRSDRAGAASAHGRAVCVTGERMRGGRSGICDHQPHRDDSGLVLLLALPAVSGATPTVTFKAKPVPIPGYPHTGFILGAGTAL